MQLIFATNNQNKVNEIKNAIPALQLLTLQEAGIDIVIPEPYDTLQENAYTKSKTIFELTGKAVFSEDTGLEVQVLHGAPGVRSARYAGETASDADNIKKLLHALNGTANRSAQFRTIIALMLHGETYYFEGICPGQITTQKHGNNGFGYDPVFIPDGSNKTFAQMTKEEKNLFSHRKKAVQKLADYLNTF